MANFVPMIEPQIVQMSDNTTFNRMQTVKRRLFAMRNGVIADTLRRAGSPFRIIFGVNLPQLVEIATQTGIDASLAEDLWANNSTRESMLLAPMLADPGSFAIEDARRWIATVPSAEVADILCHRLLRHMPYALDLALELVGHADPMTHYTGLRLMCNIANRYPQQAHRVGDAELASGNPDTRYIANLLLEY